MKKYRSPLTASIHKTVKGFYKHGHVSKRTMRDFDKLCLTPVKPLSPKKIREIRVKEGASQALFAEYLNVTTGLISQWERGEKKPQGSSLKLLHLVAKNGLESVA